MSVLAGPVYCCTEVEGSGGVPTYARVIRGGPTYAHGVIRAAPLVWVIKELLRPWSHHQGIATPMGHQGFFPLWSHPGAFTTTP
jgi:hypothetical protein